jgi:hypothetical protein
MVVPPSNGFPLYFDHNSTKTSMYINPIFCQFLFITIRILVITGVDTTVLPCVLLLNLVSSSTKFSRSLHPGIEFEIFKIRDLYHQSYSSYQNRGISMKTGLRIYCPFAEESLV